MCALCTAQLRTPFTWSVTTLEQGVSSTDPQPCDLFLLNHMLGKKICFCIKRTDSFLIRIIPNQNSPSLNLFLSLINFNWAPTVHGAPLLCPSADLVYGKLLSYFKGVKSPLLRSWHFSFRTYLPPALLLSSLAAWCLGYLSHSLPAGQPGGGEGQEARHTATS